MRVDGPLTFSSVFPILQAALDGFGIACLPNALVRPHLASGALEAVLTCFSPFFAGYHLLLRRQDPPSLYRPLPRGPTSIIERPSPSRAT